MTLETEVLLTAARSRWEKAWREADDDNPFSEVETDNATCPCGRMHETDCAGECAYYQETEPASNGSAAK